MKSIIERIDPNHIAAIKSNFLIDQARVKFEELIIMVLKCILGREPNEEDYKKCALIYRDLDCSLMYDGRMFGRFKHETRMTSDGVEIKLVFYPENERSR